MVREREAILVIAPLARVAAFRANVVKFIGDGRADYCDVIADRGRRMPWKP